MRIDPKVIPDHILRLMPEEERKRLGKSGITMQEHAEKAGDVAEKILQEQMIELLHHRGITPNWSRMDKPKTDQPGWPDLTFAVRGIPCAIEVKRPGERPEPHQLEMMAKLAHDGWTVAVITSLMGFKEFLDALK